MACEDDRLLPVKIYNIYPFSDAQQGMAGAQSFLVVLKGDASKVVPITIGHFEGHALVMALRRIPLPRPLPHNLLQDLLKKMEAVVQKLVIHTLKDDVFHAHLLIRTEDDTFSLDCRPSDGMILATLLDTPVFMSPEVMREAGRDLELAQAEGGLEPSGITSGPDVADDDEKGDASSWEKSGASQEAHESRSEPLSELEMLSIKLSSLIAQEAYEEAAEVRDRIRALAGQDT
jgi:bifunctional DNase/RNase